MVAGHQAARAAINISMVWRRRPECAMAKGVVGIASQYIELAQGAVVVDPRRLLC